MSRTGGCRIQALRLTPQGTVRKPAHVGSSCQPNFRLSRLLLNPVGPLGSMKVCWEQEVACTSTWPPTG